MKAIVPIIAALACSFGTLMAQENKTIKEETTVKRVITKEGSNVTIKEVEAIKIEKGEVIVANNEEENQVFSEETEVSDGEKIIVDETNVDANNEALIAANKKKEEEELQKSMEAAKAKAEVQRKLLEEQEIARLKAVKEKQKQLEHRGRRIVKLKKKKGN